MLGITRLLACEWAAKGINVNAIAPGYVVTNNTEALRNDPDRSAAILGRIPAGRWGAPSDIGDAAVFLLAPASGYMHGAAIAGRWRLAGEMRVEMTEPNSFAGPAMANGPISATAIAVASSFTTRP